MSRARKGKDKASSCAFHVENPLAASEWLVSRVLSLLQDAREVGRFGLVNKTFYNASISDSVWTKRLPPQTLLNRIFSNDVLASLLRLSKRDLYLKLCRSVLYDEGLKRFWIDSASGRECYMISASALFVRWGNTPHYWIWRRWPGAMFAEVAYLIAVVQFDIRGVFREVLRPGKYMVSFRMKLEETGGWASWSNGPIKLSLENRASAHSRVLSQVYFDGRTIFKGRRCISARPFVRIPRSAHVTHVRNKRDKSYGEDDGISVKCTWGSGKQQKRNNNTDIHEWLECDIGEFSVQGDNEEQPVEIEFSMHEIGTPLWKSGFVLDGVIVRPAIVAEMAELK
ncbi:hypothetical protein KP509_16G068900 [Ceratopteris richardii]|uniref:Uncharacterized protein n=1 Tax=Ceratopteris richardii TaxID=49495 RepID=A0A8T2T3A7_CERRI|nr:hypothetical protein KP509_16G068900 [Ceratopteris richardii]